MARAALVSCVAFMICLTAQATQAFQSPDVEKLLKSGTCRNCDLAGALLETESLNGIDVTGANLVAATFDGASLKDAVFRNADLAGVDFGEANLTRADLRESVLTGAILRDTNLTAANLTGAEMSGVMTADTIFCRTVMPSGEVRNPDCS